MFKLKLNNHRPSKKELAKQYIDRVTRKRAKDEKLVLDWLDNESDFDSNHLIETWERYRKQYGTKLTEEVIKYMAIANSVLDTNGFLSRRMKMENAGIDQAEFQNLLSKLFVLNISNLIVNETDLNQSVKTDIMLRVAAKHFPNKENKPITQTKPVTELPQLGPLDELVDKGF